MQPTRALVGLLVAAALLFPTIAPAQTTMSATSDATTQTNASLVALLQQLIVVLQSELQQLLLQHGQNPVPVSNTQAATTSAQFSQNEILSASAISGSAPLTVRFTTDDVQSISSGVIDFGDGSMQDDPACPPTSGNLCDIVVNVHQYTKPGVYIVKLYKSSVADGSLQEVLASLTVTVGN